MGRVSKPAHESIENSQEEDCANQRPNFSDSASPSKGLSFIHGRNHEQFQRVFLRNRGIGRLSSENRAIPPGSILCMPAYFL